ncbi:ABC transporter permease [Horticoccus luteus]|uniref:ABC transporter permease n=1 Tax=Horticoccus luteus TaxID=2862869 RepID=A0A8F9XIE6_9BACT|nr:ABC transporter permease [Horticoccus luteus]QYM80320.1 ABC transporter permease [Horticoccus luteus]
MSNVEPRTSGTRAFVGLSNIWRDLRFSFRALRRAKVFSATVILTLALCIGANSTILTVLYGLVLKPLPFPDAGQIVDICNMRPKAGQMKLRVSLAQFLDYQKHADLLSDVALWNGWMFNLGQEGSTVRYVGMQITADYFKVLGLQPLKGRFFTAEDCRPGQGAVAVVTQSFWEKKFNGDPDIVGQELRLSGRLYTIVGIVPRSFEELSTAPLLMVPYEVVPDRARPEWRMAPMGDMCARVKSGVALGAALAQLQTLEERNREALADPRLREYLVSGGHRMGLEQIRAEQTKPIKSSLLLLQGCGLLVLLLGCVNVASLTLARVNARRSELAVRRALGASTPMLARQILLEAVLLALGGGALGLLLAASALRVINVYTDRVVYGIPPVSIDGGVLGLTLLVSLVVAVLIGALPVARIGRERTLQNALQSGTRGASAGGRFRLISSGLVVAQVALALVLLIGAGLLITSFAKVMATRPGFDVDRILYARVAYDSNYTDPVMLQGLQNRILEKMREIPGVESLAYSWYLPGSDINRTTNLPIRGMPAGQDGTYPTGIMFGVSPGYLETMGIRLLEGRNFNADDLRPGARPVYIVERKFAERYFPDRSAVGQLFGWGPPDQKPEEAPVIIGVAENAHVAGLEDRDAAPYVYAALDTSRGGLSLEFRTTRTLEDMLPAIRAKLHSVDPALPIYGETTMRTQLENKAAGRRGIMWLLGGYASIALILAAVGIYGLLAYDVTQRTKEIGIRGAIGATRAQIVALILRQGLWKTGCGLTIGLVAALYLSRYIRTLLYDVAPTDPLIFGAVTLLLLLVGLLASWLPARRAARVDPMIALRCE